MAPKKAIEKCSRPSGKSSFKEKRSKHIKDVSIQRGERFEEPTTSPSASRRALSMAMHPVVSGRCIIFNFLEELGLHLGDKIEEQGWVHFFFS